MKLINYHYTLDIYKQIIIIVIIVVLILVGLGVGIYFIVKKKSINWMHIIFQNIQKNLYGELIQY